MRERDVKNGAYHNGHYDKNPTAKNINDMINGNYIGSKTTNIDMPYVIDLNGTSSSVKEMETAKKGLRRLALL